MLSVQHLEISGLPPLSFDVRSGECLAVEGPSGSGKTRLLRAVADLDPAPGLVFLEGAERGEMSAPEWRRRVRYVAAEPVLFAPTAIAHAPAGPAGERFRRLLRELELAPAALERSSGDLSTGERQRVMLALAMASEPRVLLLDEPTSSLDAPRTALVEELIRFQLLAGRAVLLVSHDRAQIDRLAERRLVLAPLGPLAAATGRAH
jgi:ABC-type iron transport system FetAB ATPase subunit